jgi:hypothetical protein
LSPVAITAGEGSIEIGSLVVVQEELVTKGIIKIG